MKKKDRHTIKEDEPNKLRFILKRLITDTGLTDVKLARALDIPNSTLHQLLNSDSLSPRVETLRPIAKYFQVSLDQLVGDQPIAHILPVEDRKTSSKKKSKEWSPELYLDCVLAICSLLKKDTYKDKVDAEKILDIIREIYFYFLLKQTKEIDMQFIEWFLTRSLD